MSDSSKKELLGLIDEIGAKRKKIADLQADIEKATAEMQAEREECYRELDTLYEKKRVVENELVDSMVSPL